MKDNHTFIIFGKKPMKSTFLRQPKVVVSLDKNKQFGQQKCIIPDSQQEAGDYPSNKNEFQFLNKEQIFSQRSQFDEQMVQKKPKLKIKKQQYEANKKQLLKGFPNNYQPILKPLPQFKDLQFQTIQSQIYFNYNTKHNAIKPHTTRFLLQKSASQINNKSNTFVLQASFTLTHNQLQSISQPSTQAHMFSSSSPNFDTQLIQQEKNEYQFKAYLYLNIRVINYRKDKSQPKQHQNLLPNLIPYQSSHSQLHQRYLQALVELKQKISQPQLSKTQLRKLFCIQIAKIIFQGNPSEQLDKEILNTYWIKVQKYHKNMIHIFKTLEDIVHYSSPEKEKIQSLHGNLKHWKIFVRYLTLNALSPNDIKRYNQDLALQFWNQFKELYFLDPKIFSFIKVETNLTQNNLRLMKSLKSKNSDSVSKFNEGFNIKTNEIADFIFDQNIMESKKLQKIMQKNKKQPSLPRQQWSKQQNIKILSFVIIHHTNIFKDSEREYGINYFLTKTIKTKNYFQCKNRLRQILQQRTTEKMMQKRKNIRKSKPPKDVIDDMVFKNKIEEHQILQGILEQIDLSAKQLLLSFTPKTIFLYKRCKTEMNLYIKQFIKRSVFKVDFSQ